MILTKTVYTSVEDGILAAYSTALELCPGLRLSCFVMFRLALRFNTYSPGLLHWCGGNRTIAPMPVKQPWTQKRKGRQGDSPGRHWGRWSLPSTSPVTSRAVTLTTFPVKGISKVSTSNRTTNIIYPQQSKTQHNLLHVLWDILHHGMN